jgi:hypothetical protein
MPCTSKVFIGQLLEGLWDEFIYLFRLILAFKCDQEFFIKKSFVPQRFREIQDCGLSTNQPGPK